MVVGWALVGDAAGDVSDEVLVAADALEVGGLTLLGQVDARLRAGRQAGDLSDSAGREGKEGECGLHGDGDGWLIQGTATTISKPVMLYEDAKSGGVRLEGKQDGI